MFKKMNVGDVVTIKSAEEASLFAQVEGKVLHSDWKGRKCQVGRIDDTIGKYRSKWYDSAVKTERCDNFSLPDVGPIPDGYEPAFEGETIQPDWLTWCNVEREWKRTRAPGCKLSFGAYIKPKQKPSAGAIVRNESGTAVGVTDEPPDNPWIQFASALSELSGIATELVADPLSSFTTSAKGLSDTTSDSVRRKEIMEVVKFALENM